MIHTYNEFEFCFEFLILQLCTRISINVRPNLFKKWAVPYYNFPDGWNCEETKQQKQTSLLVTKKVKRKWSKFCCKHKNDTVDCRLKKVEENYIFSSDLAVVVEMGMNKIDRLNWRQKYFSNVLLVNKIDNDDCNYNYNYNYENSRGCYLFDMIGMNVFIDIVCKKFLYPMDILNLFVLSKHIRYNLVNYDKKHNFMKKLFDEHSSGMCNYWNGFLGSISVYQKLDVRKLSVYIRVLHIL